MINKFHSKQCLSPSQERGKKKEKGEKPLTAVKHTQPHIFQINNTNKKNVWLHLTPGNNIFWNLELSCMDALFATTHKDARLGNAQQSTVSQEQNLKL